MKLNVRVAGDRSLTGVSLLAVLLVGAAGMALHLGVKTEIAGSSAKPTQSAWTGSRPADSRTRTDPKITLAQSPIRFEENRGQTDPRVKYVARGSGYTLFLTQNEAVLSLQSSGTRSKRADEGSAGANQRSVSSTVLRMALLGTSKAIRIQGSEELPSRSNYLVGNDSSRWRRDVPQFARVRYQQVYPGVDLVYYGNQGRLEYDFEVAPGADPRQIALQIKGAQNLRIDGTGDLLAKTDAGNVQLHAPRVYQEFGPRKQIVPAKFVLSAGNQLGFSLGDYDNSRTLIIDPVLSYSTYLGGSGDEGCFAITGAVAAGCPAVAVDTASNIYVAGVTTSADFPGAGTGFQGVTPDVFIAKFAPNATSVYSLVFSTYLGGNLTDTSAGIAVDSSARMFVAGNTLSTDFPVTSSGNQTTSSGGSHGFVTVLNAAGNTLAYSTYVEGNGTDVITGLAIDTRANAYVTGTTTSTSGFPITAGALQTTSQSAANPQFFVTKLNTAGTGAGSLAYSTYFGSTLPSSGAVVQGGGIAVDHSGLVYITGGTNFISPQSLAGGTFPILNAFQPCLNVSCAASTNADAFVAKLDPTAASGAQLKYSTYLGGGQNDFGRAIAVDSAGATYVTGSTASSDFVIPAGTQPFQATNGSGSSDAFVAKISGAGNALSYFSYLGGTGADIGYSVAVDASNAFHVAGSTTSADFPEIPSGIATFGGSSDGFVALIQTTAPGQIGGYARTLGGTGDENATGIAIDANANSYIAGETTSTDFPLISAQFTTRNGSSDAFVSKLAPSVAGLVISGKPSVNIIGIGNPVTFTYTIQNKSSDVVSNVLFTDNLPASGGTFVSATTTPGSCTAVVNATVTCSIGSLAVNAQAVVKINVTPTVAGSLTNSGTLQTNGVALVATSTPAVTVTDFTVSVSPSTNTVAAGDSATYEVKVGVPRGQSNFFPNSVSLACSAGLPTGAACTFSTNPLTMTNTSPVSSTVTITTTARPVSTGQLRGFRYWYAVLFPITGLTLFGLGAGARRRRKYLVVLFGFVLIGLCGLQLACNSGSGTTTPQTGTPAGTYPITMTGTSGAAHTARLTLVVQ